MNAPVTSSPSSRNPAGIELWTTLEPVETSVFEPFLTPKEAAALVQYHPKTLLKMARAGQIPAIRLGKHWRFRKSWLEAWIRHQLQSSRQPN